MKLLTNRPGIYSDYVITRGSKEKRKVCAVLVYNPQNKGDINAGALQMFSSTEQIKTEGHYEGDLEDYVVNPASLLFEDGASRVYVCVAYDENELQKGLGDIEFYDDIDLVILACEDKEIQKIVSEKITDMAKNNKERICIMACEDVKKAVSSAKALGNERVVMIGQKGRLKNADGNESQSFFVSCALAIELAKINDLAKNLNGIYMNSLESIEKITMQETELCLINGVTAFEYFAQTPICIKPITTKSRQIGDFGTTFESLSTILIVDYVMKMLREKLDEIMKNASNSKATREKISSQIIVLMEKFLMQELINSYEVPVVYAKEDDAGICIIELSFSVASAINQICLTAQIAV